MNKTLTALAMVAATPATAFEPVQTGKHADNWAAGVILALAQEPGACADVFDVTETLNVDTVKRLSEPSDPVAAAVASGAYHRVKVDLHHIASVEWCQSVYATAVNFYIYEPRPLNDADRDWLWKATALGDTNCDLPRATLWQRLASWKRDYLQAVHSDGFDVVGGTDVPCDVLVEFGRGLEE